MQYQALEPAELNRVYGGVGTTGDFDAPTLTPDQRFDDHWQKASDDRFRVDHPSAWLNEQARTGSANLSDAYRAGDSIMPARGW